MTEWPRFSVSQHTTWDLSFEEDLALFSRLGVRGVELCERKLSNDAGKRREQLDAVKDAGLTVTSVQTRVIAPFPDSLCPEMPDPRKRAASIRESMEMFAAAFPGEPLTFVTVTGKAPAYDFSRATRTVRDLYPALADHAAELGCRIAFEPLGPVFMNTDTFICTLDGALGLIDHVNRPNFGLLFDVWHLWREHQINARLEQLGGSVFAVHISDWPANEPRCHGDRRIPGDGVIDLSKLLTGLLAAGYDGAFCLEIFSSDSLADSLRRMDQADLIERSRAGLERALGYRC